MFQFILLDVIISILDIVFLIALLFLVDYYTSPDKSHLKILWITKFLSHQSLLPIGIFTLLLAGKNGLAYFISKKQFHFIYGVASRISAEKMSDYLDGNYLDHVNTDSSVHLRSINHDPIDFCHYVLRGVQQITGQSILILFAIIPILIFKPVLFSLLLVILLPPVLIIALLSRKRSSSVHDAAKNIHRKLIQYSKEAIMGFIESNVFQKKHFFLDRFTTLQERQSNHLAQQQIAQVLPSRLIEIFAVFGLFVLISINFFTQGKSIDLITIGAFTAAAYKIIPGIVKILNSISQVKAYSFTVTNLFNHKSRHSSKQLNGNASIDSIEFCSIYFSYKKEALLNNFSLSLKKGDFIGITGMSGRGKTTMLNLLLGFLEPDRGSILINTAIKNSEELQCLWKNITYVPQRTFLINDTILKNITLQEKVPDVVKLEEVIQVTGLRQLSTESSDCLNKIISENGKNISGGQRQRIALARALYKNADTIILDEPFNELDRKSENCMLNQLKTLARSGKIIILITHDKESLSFCSKTVSLDEV